MTEDEPIRVWVCQGPPVCDLEDGAAVAAQVAGCVWCRVTTFHADGTETVRDPLERPT